MPSCNLNEKQTTESGEIRVREIYGVLFESAPDAMMVTDRTGRIVKLNIEAEKMFGYSREELTGQEIEKLIPERFRKAHGERRDGYQADPSYRPMSGRQALAALRKDGSEFPVEISLNPVSTGSEVFFHAIVRDLSERQDAQLLGQRLKFEQTVAGLSARFINLPVDRVDGEITAGLEILVEALDTDRASLGQFDTRTGDLVSLHNWARPGIPPFGERLVKGVLPWLEGRIRRGEITALGSPEDLPPEAHHEREYARLTGVKSTLAVPFRVAGKVVGGISTGGFRKNHHWDDYTVSRVKDIADIFANALARKWADEELQRAMGQIRELKERLERENVYLQEEIKLEHSHAEVIGSGAGIRNVMKKVEQVASTDSAVLIVGETGTGKELVARAIHELSRRKEHAMVKVNCAALPATLIESELFGREKGAYTGALAREIGRFELADKSTLFLDEIGELPLELQPKLLRVLQEGDFERLGSAKTIHVDVRVIAATNRDLFAMMKAGKFREDLYYRLSVFPISLPPLRERAEDIPALTLHILNDLGRKMGRKVRGIHPSTMESFRRYSWPGNVRELRNIIERNLIVSDESVFRAEIMEAEAVNHPKTGRLEEMVVDHMKGVLQRTRWRVRGPGGAAEILGIKPTTLEARMKKLGLSRRA
ncbi:MAG TPA: sigma 54-interacting transcriptional regulator [Verrucomicrobiae bacterium]|nr:sigma 54-interacting transcriptional regulator [Verrucomicrobiae bacterium]